MRGIAATYQVHGAFLAKGTQIKRIAWTADCVALSFRLFSSNLQILDVIDQRCLMRFHKMRLHQYLFFSATSANNIRLSVLANHFRFEKISVKAPLSSPKDGGASIHRSHPVLFNEALSIKLLALRLNLSPSCQAAGCHSNCEAQNFAHILPGDA